MGVLASASLLALSFLLAEGFKIEYVKEPVADQEITQSQTSPKYITYKPVIRQQSIDEKSADDNAAHSAGTYEQYEPLYDHSSPQLLKFGPEDVKTSPTIVGNIYSKYGDRYTEPSSEGYYQSENYGPAYRTENQDFEDEEFGAEDTEGYTHYKTTSNVNVEGPHQIETIETKSFHKKVPQFDTSEYKLAHTHEAHHKGKEVHYHQHKHVHKHEHKQEHIHKHKQEHKHAHEEKHKHGHGHKQEHKHDHHEEHKHGHEHKQEHKHGHHEAHKHGHEHKQEHKHSHHEGHKHGHDHKHHQDHKHDHHHGHKHHQDHKHDHHHGHKHGHHHGHKHDHHEDHKHDQHHGHKHDHHHGHKHGHHHGHKHGHHHGHKHEHHSKHH